MCRMEDITDPEQLRVDPKCRRTISVYGYLRGTHLKPNTCVHIPGNTYFNPAFMSFNASEVRP